MRFLVLALALSFGCSHDKDKSVKSESDPYAADLPAVEDLSAFQGQAVQLKDALLADHLSCGFVVSRAANGDVVDQGDSTLWTGEMLAVLSCSEGQPLLDGLISAMHAAGGMVPRYCLDTGSARKTSRDMELGAMLGLTERANKCPDDRPAIEAAWAEHVAYVNANNGDLGPGTGNDLTALRWLWERVSEALHARAEPATQKGSFELGQALTAESIGTAHSLAVKFNDPSLNQACYPMHLGVDQMWLAQRLGSAVNWQSRKGFCNPAAGMDIPLVDWFCEKKTAAQWLGQEFQLNQWVYRNQRCGTWESPDGSGKSSPSADWLFEYFVAGGTFPEG